jgi:UPF0716 protein FxsA
MKQGMLRRPPATHHITIPTLHHRMSARDQCCIVPMVQLGSTHRRAACGAVVCSMSLVKWTSLAFVTLPAAEVLTFLIVAAYVGWFWAAIAFNLGTWRDAAQTQRTSQPRALCAGLRSDGLTALHLDTPGAANMLAALFLTLPGFITDALGAALLVPAFRRRAAAVLAKTLMAPKTSRGGSPGEIIDLEPGEWRQTPDREPRRQRSSRHKAGSR